MYNYPGCTLHQISPYIGKMRPSLARRLIIEYTKEGEWIWDPFCGSGTIALECRLLSRHIIASDINPYACALIRAKLHAPISINTAFSQLASAATILKEIQYEKSNEVPQWVEKFFHSQTLKEAKALINEFLRKGQYFNAGCLLGILHHQRPGFLSYPASHLVPYLRDRLFPPNLYPEAYKYRNPIPRLKAKIKRVLKSPPLPKISRFKIYKNSVHEKYLPDASIDAVITSPPYMDALDYARDNRLRLWFLGVNDYRSIKKNEIRKIRTFKQDMLAALKIMSRVIKPGGRCILVLGDMTRANRSHDVPTMISDLVKINIKELHLENQWVENIPDHRRARRNGRATKRETILVFGNLKYGS